MKYYVLNKESDYRRGWMEHMEYADGGIMVEETEDRGIFISRVYDGMESGCIWHRMTVKLCGEHSVPVRFRFFASDSAYAERDGTVAAIEAVIEGGESTEEKLAAFQPYLKAEAEEAESLLLHQVKGRYMWFVAECFCLPGETSGFSDAMLYFPKQSWLEYLPDIYSRGALEDSFLERYLAIFQSLYDDLGGKIDQIPSCLDGQTADRRVLSWLAGWLGIENIKLWNEEQLRYLVNNASRLYRKRGTKEGICEFIKLYTGEEPLIAEQHHIERFADNEEQYALIGKLYGREPQVFTVLLKASCLPTGKEFADLQKIIEEIKPAWMDFRMITLRPYILLDSYSYLGINSVLGEYLPLELGGLSMLSFATVGREKDEKKERN